MRLSTILVLSTLLFANLAPSAKSYPVDPGATSSEGFFSHASLGRFTLPSENNQINPCETQDSKPGCSRRDFRASGGEQSPSDSILLAQKLTNSTKAEPNCPMMKTHQQVGRGSGRCEP
ncbi:hypothetical protein [Laspinema olomoucense]|uniref:Uncharacterized protein n=1 Tax=Laspinema olomoucense D3b TaxID=2953688 RepID=A0ABT2N7A0_9CYAN|nr:MULTISPECIES: hypothetical protein [unclassified Laspinema]MCT7971343.1 hypothetical protein [Laspinema sp. D3d]MCT7978558.1 hypothetical protein [Laspinema sp. D3b]MCT7987216.1 hypothetical protein [Laspinema sp. D3a]